MAIPKKVEERIRDALKRYVPILGSLRDRDVSEADTVTVIKDMLSDVFGFDKYAEVTSEHAIRGTYCDLAIKVEGKLRLLLEVKAIGISLSEKHIKQAVDYAANQGLDYVVLTNGVRWLFYHVQFKKPIEAKLMDEFDLLAINTRNESDIEKVYLLTREGMLKGALREYAEKKSATSRYVLAAVLLHDEDVLAVIRRELRKLTDILVPTEAIAEVLRNEIIKREVLEGDEAQAALRQVARGNRAKASSAQASECTDASGGDPPLDLGGNPNSSLGE